MTTTILTDEQIESIAQQYTVTAPDGNVVTTGPWRFARAIEQAVLQSPEAQAWKKDAERYRRVRRGQQWSIIDGIGCELRADTLDAAIDAAMEK